MSLWTKLLETVLPNRRSVEIEDELAFHVEMRARQLMQSGVDPDEAMRQARRQFGNSTKLAEDTRETHLLQGLSALLRDSRYALRGLWRRPLFSLTGLASLALGIGVNVAIFSVLDTLLLKPLPLADASLVMAFVESRNGETTNGNPARMRDYRENLRTLKAVGGYYGDGLVLAGTDGPTRLNALRTVGDVISVLGHTLVLGRNFTPQEQLGRANVAIISHQLWQRLFQRDASVIGKLIRSKGMAFEIIGVMPAEAALLDEVDLWIPAEADQQNTSRMAGFLTVVGRLADGVDLTKANAELATVAGQMLAANPVSDKGLAVGLKPLGEVLAGEARQPVLLLMGVAITILLLACVNLAGLLLARNAERAQEAAIRMAIGAGRAALVRLFLLEAVWLAIPGGMLGLLVGEWSFALLKAMLPAETPLIAAMRVDGRAAIFALLLTVFCAIAIGLLPAFEASRVMPRGAIGARSALLRSALVVGQIAVSLTLLVSAGVLTHRLLEARQRSFGFQPDHVLALSFDISWDTDKAKLHQFYTQAADAVRLMPGVISVGLVDRLPLGGGAQSAGYLRIRGMELPETQARQQYGFRAVSADYFTTLRIPLMKGRVFGEPQGDRTPREILINETFAQRYFAGIDPVGRVISYRDAVKEPLWFEVTGVVKDVPVSPGDIRPRPEVFVHFTNTYWAPATLVARVNGDAAIMTTAVRKRIADIDPYVLIRRGGSVDSQVELAWTKPKLLAKLTGGLSLASLLLACLGLYGILAGFVKARTKEFGIRLALGATPWSLQQLSLRQGIFLALIGIIVGGFLAVPVLRLIAAQVPGGEANDPMAFSIAAILLFFTALVACYAPVRRVAKLDAIEVLRHE